MTLRPKPYLREISLRRGAIESFSSHPFDIPAVSRLDGLRFHPDVTFFVGENGTGKSTLLEAIALALGFGPEGGTRNIRFETTKTVSPLHAHLDLVKGYRMPKDHFFLRAESFYNVATYVDEASVGKWGYGDRSLHTRSHGESFLVLLTKKFRGKGLYLMDEPEAALSPTRQLAALSAIHRLVEDESQFIIATHSPILLAYPRAKIVRFDAEGLTEVPFEETEHFAVTRDFLNHYPRRLETLLAEDDDR